MTYTVKAGDTLYGISNQFGVNVSELADLNNVNASTLKVGQVLNIPTDSGSNPNAMFMYTVKKGDSLYTIAQKYNTTVGEIINLNNLKSDKLSIGQVLRIPEEYTKEEDMVMPLYTSYTVKKGDSLYSIARLNNITVDTILKDNGLVSPNLSVGQKLKIRTNVENIEECIGEDFNVPDNSITYIVKKGDSLYTIAKKYNTSVSEIVNLNNLASNNLSIGQTLKIPGSDTIPSSTYTVKSGDTLYSIAKKFNISVDSIKSKNNLKNNSISVGQVLNI
ncbi:MAG: LysM peptidoglycan-binding domain-containing protein [Bacilli bacterium]|nr:LysM peptidoglycan-binding domain-containing protein [Bacilli bacterium]